VVLLLTRELSGKRPAPAHGDPWPEIQRRIPTLDRVAPKRIHPCRPARPVFDNIEIFAKIRFLTRGREGFHELGLPLGRTLVDSHPTWSRTNEYQVNLATRYSILSKGKSRCVVAETCLKAPGQRAFQQNVERLVDLQRFEKGNRDFLRDALRANENRANLVGHAGIVPQITGDAIDLGERGAAMV